MRWLRLLTLWVFLIGSWQGAAVHAAQMLDAGPTAAQAAIEQPAPPCHSMQHASTDGNADRAMPSSDNPADSGNCCHSGHCDCVHANPATLEFGIALRPTLSADQHPGPVPATLTATAVDTPLRPPTI